MQEQMEGLAVVAEPEGWLLYLGQVLDLIKAYPLGILVLAAVGFGVWQTRALKLQSAQKDALVKELFRAKAEGHVVGDEAQKTIVTNDRRKKPNNTDYTRRRDD